MFIIYSYSLPLARTSRKLFPRCYKYYCNIIFLLVQPEVAIVNHILLNYFYYCPGGANILWRRKWRLEEGIVSVQGTVSSRLHISSQVIQFPGLQVAHLASPPHIYGNAFLRFTVDGIYSVPSRFGGKNSFISIFFFSGEISFEWSANTPTLVYFFRKLNFVIRRRLNAHESF